MLRLNNSISLLKQVRKIATTSINMSSKLSTNHTSGGEEPVVLSSVKNHARLITLNRVKKLNSLNTEMIELMTPPILEYAKSKENNVIILTSNSPKALCAGGDVAECAVQIRKGNPGYGADFLTKNITSIILFLLYQNHISHLWMESLLGRCWIISTCTISSSNRKPNLPCRKWILDFSQMLVPHSFT